MTRMARALTTTAMILIVPALVGAEELSAPPGFSWQNVPELKARFLVPEGWHFQGKPSGDELVYLITQEEVHGGVFSTGVTIRVRRHLKGTKADDYAEQWVSRELARGKVEQPLGKGERGGIRSFAGTVEVARPVTQGGPVKRGLSAVANPKTNTVYTLALESPVGKWTEAWEKGRWVIGYFQLDDEV